MSEFFDCEVLSIQQLSPTVRHFRLCYPMSSTFQAGQFVMLDLPIEADFSTRSYSIASEPNSEGIIELCIVLKEDGAGTRYIFDSIKTGDKLKVSEPQGKFVIADEEKGLVMICTGTGVAPFRSMIRDLVTKHGSLPHPVYLIFGNRFKQDILYAAEWKALMETDSNFHFIPVLSRDTDWEGARGYVHAFYMPVALENKEYHYYLCGWTSMVREAKNKLKELGYSRKQLKFELYD
ncbi:MAG: oxidoreductase [Bacteroidetes bacterium]|nr:oxidoreductase [Bacteroidota bacterium]